MQYIYAAMLLHAGQKEISENSVESVLKAAGVDADVAKTKSMVAALKNINIDEALKQAMTVQAAPAAAQGEAKKEDKKEDDSKAAEAAAEGLGSLFG
ncbi:MAG: 50S ribosomal protein L12 [Candidatus Diapherotrites archaeon]